MTAIFCHDCKQWDQACVCSVVAPAPKRNNALLLVGGILGAARFYWSSPKEKSAMIKEALVRLNKINGLRTEQSQSDTPEKKRK